MLNKIIYYSLHNRLIILTASILLMVAGIFVTSRTEVDVFPDLNAPTVVVMTEASGLAAEEVEQLVTFPIETSINGAAGVRRVRSSSTNGFSIVWVEFDWDTDVYLARQIVSERLATVSEELPDNVNRPVMGPQSSILGEVLIIGLTADSTSMMDLRTLADWTIRPRLLSTGGVAQVAVLGGDVKEFQILLDHGKMKHYGVTLQEVMAVTEEMNRNENGGVIYEYGNEYIVRGMLSTTDIEQLSTALVKKVGDMPVLLRDVAEVKIGYQEPKLGTASVRGKNAVLVTVTKQPETNTLELTEKLEAAMKDLQKSMPQDVKVYTDIFKQSNFIENSIGNIKQALYEGAFFVVIVLFLCLANVRTTVISLVTLPLSLLISILVLHLFGLSINTMSLGGMAIAIGSLVDDSIVDVENVTTNKGQRTFKKRAQQTGFSKVSEGGKIGAGATPQFERISYEIEKYAGYFPVTSELLADSDANITNVLIQWIGDESRVTRNKMILGVLDTKDKTAIKGIDDIKKALNVTLGQAFKPTSSIITNDDGLQWLDTLKDSDGDYLLQPNPTKPTEMRLGAGATTVPVFVVPNADLPTATNKVPMIIGDLKEAVKFFDRNQMSILSSNIASIGDLNAYEMDLTLFRAIEREDCVMKDAQAFVYGQVTVGE